MTRSAITPALASASSGQFHPWRVETAARIPAAVISVPSASLHVSLIQLTSTVRLGGLFDGGHGHQPLLNRSDWPARNRTHGPDDCSTPPGRTRRERVARPWPPKEWPPTIWMTVVCRLLRRSFKWSRRQCKERVARCALT